MMKRTVGLLAAILVFSGLLVLGGTPSAQAAVSCRDQNPGQWMRVCKVDNSRGGGLIEGSIGWTYGSGGNGQVAVTIDDRERGGCTVLRVRYRGGSRAPETKSWGVCDGKSRNFKVDLNRQYIPFLDGVFLVDWCEGSKRTPKRCVNLWSQRVDGARA